MGNYWTNAVRHPEDVGVGHIRRTVVFGQSGLDAGDGIPIGALEAGAVPLRVSAYIETLFDGTTPTVEVGTAADPDAFATSANLAPATAGYKNNVGTGAEMGKPLAANTVAYVFLTETDTTAGKITVIMEFVNKREIDGIPFPNN